MPRGNLYNTDIYPLAHLMVLCNSSMYFVFFLFLDTNSFFKDNLSAVLPEGFVRSKTGVIEKICMLFFGL